MTAARIPAWLAEAYKFDGLAEIPGPRHNPVILGWLRRLHAWYADDETPWCGTFVAHCVEATALPLPKYWMRAKAWAEWGERLAEPETGCIVVFERQGGGHVGFVVGRTVDGRLLVIGGNQGNRVCVAAFDRARVLAYVWPAGVPLPAPAPLIVMDATGVPLSTNEA